MPKQIFSGFIILMIATAFGLYLYGKNMLFNLTAPTTEEYVESKVNPYGWVNYQPDSNDYEVKFPNNPQKANDQTVDEKTKLPKKYNMLISENMGKVFMISVITFDNDSFINTRLDDIVHDMTNSNPENKLKNFTHGVHNNYKDADFTITNPQYTILGRAIINKNKIYVLSSIGLSAKEINDEFNFFVQSFKIKDSN